MATDKGVTEEADGSASNRYSRAYDELRSLLLSGALEPGTRLTEAQLTQMFNVSRGTIRSVLVRLAQEGYVISEMNRGVRTRTFSVDEAADILEARETLEAALAAKAAERATDEELNALEQTLDAMRQAQATGAQDEYTRKNRIFHAQVRSAAHQTTLAGFVEALLYPLVMRQYRDLASPHPRGGSLDEHQAIYSAIRTRNPEAAAAAMRHHISRARHALQLGQQQTSPSNGEPLTGADGNRAGTAAAEDVATTTGHELQDTLTVR